MEEVWSPPTNVGFKLAAVTSVLVSALAVVLVCCTIQNSLNKKEIGKIEEEIERLKHRLSRLDQDGQDNWQEIDTSFGDIPKEEENLEEDFKTGGFLAKLDSIDPSLVEKGQDKVKLARYKRSRKTSINEKEKRGKANNEKRGRKKAKKLAIPAIHLFGSLNQSCPGNDSVRITSDECQDLNGKQIGNYGFLPKDETMAFWRQAKWTETNHVKRFFTFNQKKGSVTIHKDGIYFIYAQVHFFDTSAYLSYSVQRKTVSGGGKSDHVFYCRTSASPIQISRHRRRQLLSTHSPCNINGLAQLNVNDVISLRLPNTATVIDARSALSYWGMIWISSG